MHKILTFFYVMITSYHFMGNAMCGYCWQKVMLAEYHEWQFVTQKKSFFCALSGGTLSCNGKKLDKPHCASAQQIIGAAI